MTIADIVKELTPSDYVQTVGILASLFVGMVSIIISVCTLRQNSKMIEGESRPYIAIYMTSLYVQDLKNYIVIKNFGKSAALITGFDINVDLTKYAGPKKFRPFE